MKAGAKTHTSQIAIVNRATDFPVPAEQIAQAAAEIRHGNLVAFPTETVYGLGADALNARSVAKIFELKQRPRFDPLIVHIAEPCQLAALVTSIPPAARELIDRFWPGPLTVVLPKRDVVPAIVTSDLPHVAVRLPDHDVARALITAAGRPIAAPSANRFGKISPTTAAHVRESFGAATPFLLDAGPCRVGVESTVVAFADGAATILRPGGICVEDIVATIGEVGLAAQGSTPISSARSTTDFGPHSPVKSDPADLAGAPLPPFAAPGMLASHYAPATRLYLVDAPAVAPSEGRWGLLCLVAPAEARRFAVVEVLSPQGDLCEAAANLFAAMRRLDAAGLDGIMATRLPEQGLGQAIMDRLQRAAAK